MDEPQRAREGEKKKTQHVSALTLEAHVRTKCTGACSRAHDLVQYSPRHELASSAAALDHPASLGIRRRR